MMHASGVKTLRMGRGGGLYSGVVQR
jgi:hypothetical protein